MTSALVSIVPTYRDLPSGARNVVATRLSLPNTAASSPVTLFTPSTNVLSTANPVITTPTVFPASLFTPRIGIAALTVITGTVIPGAYSIVSAS